MSLKSRIKKRFRSTYDSTIGKAHDFASNVGGKVSTAARRTGEKARAAYQRYKDPLIIGTATALGAILGTVVPGVGTLAGAAVAGSLASGAVGAHHARKQEQATKQAEKEFSASTAGLEEGGAGGLIAALRRRRLQRGAGEAVASYESDTARPYMDEQEVAA